MNRTKFFPVYKALYLALPLLAAHLVAAPAALPAASQNWPQWRGPLQTGGAIEGRPPAEWSETKNLKWKVKIPGESTATPAIWGNKVFVLTAIPTGKKSEAKSVATLPAFNIPAGQAQRPPEGGPPGGPGGRRGPGGLGGPGGRGGRGGMGGEKPTEIHQFAILCLDRETGKTLWQKIAREEVPHEGHHPSDGSFAPSSPVTDGKFVYAYFGSRGLHCYDFDGNLKWSKDLGQMRIKMAFGEGSSPALSGNTIVLTRDQEEGSFIVALDKTTGQELWRTSRDEETAWATPLIVEHEGKKQVVTSATKKIRSYDLATGKLIWECAGLTPNVIPSPVAANGIVYAISGFRGNALLAIKLGKTGDLTDTDAILWKHNKATPYVPSPLFYGNKLYFFSNNNGVISCFDAATGKPFFSEERLDDIHGIYSSPVGAGGQVYFVGRDGTSVVIRNSDKLEILATNKLDDRIDASPAVAGNELYLRGHNYLYCIAEK